jgi:hypothetical protein
MRAYPFISLQLFALADDCSRPTAAQLDLSRLGHPRRTHPPRVAREGPSITALFQSDTQFAEGFLNDRVPDCGKRRLRSGLRAFLGLLSHVE